MTQNNLMVMVHFMNGICSAAYPFDEILATEFGFDKHSIIILL